MRKKYSSTTYNLMIREFESFGKTLKIEQNTSTGGLGANVWDAALVLSKYFENKRLFPPDYFKDKKVLELGAGTGMISIILALQGAEVYITDRAELLDLIRHNVELNCPELLQENKIHIEELIWGDESNRLVNEVNFDIIIGCDVVYSKYAWKDLAKTVCDCSHELTDVILSCERRSKDDMQFFAHIHDYFTIRKVEEADLDKLYSSEDIAVFHLKKRMYA